MINTTSTRYTHVHRPRYRKPFRKATKERCIRENVILPWLIIGFFVFVSITFGVDMLHLLAGE